MCAKRQTGDLQAIAWLCWIESGVVLVLGVEPRASHVLSQSSPWLSLKGLVCLWVLFCVLYIFINRVYTTFMMK